MRIYLDSAPLIYLVENVVPYASTLAARLAAPDVNQVCSELSRLECRVKPIRDRETTLLTAFDSYFAGIFCADLTTNQGALPRDRRGRSRVTGSEKRTRKDSTRPIPAARRAQR